MKITIDNKEIIFDNIVNKNQIIYLNSDFKYNSILTNYHIKYSKFIELLETSLDCYVDFSDKNLINDTIEQYFNYFKITSNSLVKKNMITKIANIIINDTTLLNNKNILAIFDNYVSIKADEYYIFLKIILNINCIKDIKSTPIKEIEEEYFTILDFILDYYE